MPTVGVRCNPILFELRTDATSNLVSPKPLIQLPYRMILAVLSTNAIMLYDTQHSHMISIIRNQHCANLTDVAWSNDGATLFVTSSDGFCSVVEFSNNELGLPCPREAYPASMTDVNIQPWFAVKAQEAQDLAKERALDKMTAATAAVAVTGDKRPAENTGAAAAVGVGSSAAAVGVQSGATTSNDKKSKKRRVSLVAVSQSEASQGNLMNSP